MITFVLVKNNVETHEAENTNLESGSILTAWRLASTLNRMNVQDGTPIRITLQAYKEG